MTPHIRKLSLHPQFLDASVRSWYASPVIVKLGLPLLLQAGGRGLSIEEKRAKLIEIFTETKGFFQLKELEKLGAKKGVVVQTVKEVLQSLVDDNLVEFDKSGAQTRGIIVSLPSAVYWSFPSARGSMLMTKLEAAKEELATLEAREMELKDAIAQAKAEREPSFERDQLLETYRQRQESLAEAKMELGRFESGSIGKYEEKQRAISLAREAADRWTDNVNLALSYCSSTFGIPLSDLRSQLEIPQGFDDLPDD
ncbi:Mnd1 family-domain-containing protein [Cantharellus anzutake]|uniref:Mnd1 family-domain-containing protein n=1 Tax=Cantharellus anzutake TaxID=1750568 RepID=UPI001908C78D|nr:Mnd1 family-domain-containing protein [Cantharellus anzutake]KAF8339777.1 Mnd1 family-domain-containing protein [Cantharellus anzutake]